MASPLRQIQDIQVQAERLISNKANLDQIAEFSKYSDEIKFYLMENIDDEEILSYVRDIPIFEIEESELEKTAEGIFAGILSIASYGLAGYFRNQRARDKALDVVRDIRSKYASIEFMCRNYFE
jgi:hypothetical protein